MNNEGIGVSNRARRMVELAQQANRDQQAQNAPQRQDQNGDQHLEVQENHRVPGQRRPENGVGYNSQRMILAVQAQLEQAQAPGQVLEGQQPVQADQENNHPNLQDGEQPLGQQNGCADFDGETGYSSDGSCDSDLTDEQYQTAVLPHGRYSTSSEEYSDDTEALKEFRRKFKEEYASRSGHRCQSPADDALAGSLNDRSEAKGAAAGGLSTNSNGGNGAGGNGRATSDSDGYRTPPEAVIENPSSVLDAGIPPAAVRPLQILPPRPLPSNGADAVGRRDGYTTPTNAVLFHSDVLRAGPPPVPRKAPRLQAAPHNLGASGFVQCLNFPVVQPPVDKVEDEQANVEFKPEVKAEVKAEFKAPDLLSDGCKPGSILGKRNGPDDNNSNGGGGYSIGGSSSAVNQVVVVKQEVS